MACFPSFLPIPPNSFTDFILTALRKMRLWFPRKKKSPLADSKESRGREGWGGGGLWLSKSRVGGHITYQLSYKTVTMQRILLRSPAPKENQKSMFLHVHSYTHSCMWCYMYICVCEEQRSTWTVFGSGSLYFLKQGLSLYWSSPIYWITAFRTPPPLPQTNPGLELGIKHLTSWVISPTPTIQQLSDW